MPPPAPTSDEQQLRDNIRHLLQRLGIEVDGARLETLSRTVSANLIAGDTVARAVAGDRPPAAFHPPDPRPDA